MKNFYSCLKKVYSPTSVDSSPLLSADGTKLISEKNKILERWPVHFDGELKRPSSFNDKAPVNESLDVTPPLEEVQIAIRQLYSSKALGSDSVPVEIYKEGGSALTSKLLTFIQLILVKK